MQALRGCWDPVNHLFVIKWLRGGPERSTDQVHLERPTTEPATDAQDEILLPWVHIH